MRPRTPSFNSGSPTKGLIGRFFERIAGSRPPSPATSEDRHSLLEPGEESHSSQFEVVRENTKQIYEMVKIFKDNLEYDVRETGFNEKKKNEIDIGVNNFFEKNFAQGKKISFLEFKDLFELITEPKAKVEAINKYVEHHEISEEQLREMLPLINDKSRFQEGSGEDKEEYAQLRKQVFAFYKNLNAAQVSSSPANVHASHTNDHQTPSHLR